MSSACYMFFLKATQVQAEIHSPGEVYDRSDLRDNTLVSRWC